MRGSRNSILQVGRPAEPFRNAGGTRLALTADPRTAGRTRNPAVNRGAARVYAGTHRAWRPWVLVAATFRDLAREATRQGAVAACERQAAELERRATLVPAPRSEALRRAARGLRLAAALLGELRGPGPEAERDTAEAEPGAAEVGPGAASPLGPIGLRGALAAGHLAIARGRPGDAELIGGGIEEAAPRHPAGPRLLGQALFAQGRFRPAARAYRAALARSPEDGLSRALHAETLWFAGEWEGALCALRRLRERGGPGADLAAALEEAMRGGAVPRERAGR